MKLGWISVGYVYFNGKLNTPDLRCGGFDNLMAYFQFKRRKHSETINERVKLSNMWYMMREKCFILFL